MSCDHRADPCPMVPVQRAGGGRDRIVFDKRFAADDGPVQCGTTSPLLAVPLSMTATTTPLPRFPGGLHRRSVNKIVIEAVIRRETT